MKFALVSAFALSLTLPALAQETTDDLNRRVLESLQSAPASETITRQEDITELVDSPMVSSNEIPRTKVVETNTLTDDRIALEVPGAVNGSSDETGELDFETEAASEEDVHVVVTKDANGKTHTVKRIIRKSAEPQSLMQDPDRTEAGSISVKASVVKNDKGPDSLTLSVLADEVTEETLEDGTQRITAHKTGDPSAGIVIEMKKISEKQ